MKCIVLLFALIFSIPLMAQKSKNKVEEIPPVSVSEGIVYALPRTGIKIAIEARQTMLIPGPFAPYAEPLLGIKESIGQKQTLWEITNVSFDTFSEPDPAGVFKTNTLIYPLLQLTSNGCLAGYNSSNSGKQEYETISNSFVAKGNGLSGLFVNTVQIPTSSGRTPVEQRAQEAAAQVMKLRATRFDIVAGLLDVHHPDGKAYEESLEELQTSEKEMIEQFTGRIKSDNYTFVYYYIPSSKSVKGDVVFRFDEILGFLAKNDFSGKAVMIDVEAEEVPLAKTENAAMTNTGLFYRQPGFGNIKLTNELTVIGTARLAIAQFGNVLPLPAELLNGSYSIEFHPESGAIKSILKK
jgi:hypothetical protein